MYSFNVKFNCKITLTFYKLTIHLENLREENEQNQVCVWSYRELDITIMKLLPSIEKLKNRKKRVNACNCQQKKGQRSMLLCVCLVGIGSICDFYQHICLHLLSNAVLWYEKSVKTTTKLIFWCTQTHGRRLMSEKSLTIRIDAVCYHKVAETKFIEHTTQSQFDSNNSRIPRAVFFFSINFGAAEAVKISSWTAQWFVWKSHLSLAFWHWSCVKIRRKVSGTDFMSTKTISVCVHG